MINCTLGDVIRSVPALTRLQEEKLRVTVSLHIRRISKMIEAEHAIYVEEERKLLDRHGKKDDNGDFSRPPLVDEAGIPMVNEDGEPVLDEGSIHLIDPPAFQKDMDELFGNPVSLPANPISLSGLITVKMSSNDIEDLFYLFEDDITAPV